MYHGHGGMNYGIDTGNLHLLRAAGGHEI